MLPVAIWFLAFVVLAASEGLTPAPIMEVVEPRVDYFDGFDESNACMSRMERRVTGKSGLLISHNLFDNIPYNGSRNCFVMIVVPIGYRVRLRILALDINGQMPSCDRDTLHIFDHDAATDPNQPHRPFDENNIPGQILGELCGTISNTSVMMVSRQNTMTLWFHTGPRTLHNGKGFKLLWSAFRHRMSVPCSPPHEFECSNTDCIPLELACNSFPECGDESDLETSRQVEAKCEKVYMDPLATISGISIVLITVGCFLACVCVSASICLCCPCLNMQHHLHKDDLNEPPKKEYTPATDDTRTSKEARYHHHSQTSSGGPPLPPAFYPPSPPHAVPHNSALRRTVHVNDDPLEEDHYYHRFQCPRNVYIKSEYAQGIACPPNSDYSIVRPVDSHII